MFSYIILAVICCILHVTQAIHPELLPGQTVGNLSPPAFLITESNCFIYLIYFLRKRKKSISMPLIHLSPLVPLSVSDCIMKDVFLLWPGFVMKFHDQLNLTQSMNPTSLSQILQNKHTTAAAKGCS